MSVKVIDVFNTLNLISDYNSVGLTSSNSRVTINGGGAMTIYNTTQSEYSSVGALVVQNGGLSINAFTNATSVSNGGALTVAGGAAIAGDLIVGGSILYSNAEQASSTFAYLTLTATDQSIDLSSGALVVFGGVSIQSSGDATSVTSGGGLTIAGGAAIGSSLYVGGSAILNGVIATNVTVSSLLSTNFKTTNSSVSNLLANSSTLSNLLVSNGLSAISPTNTVGTIFTNAAFVGINTTGPSYNLDVNGSLRVNGTSGVLNRIQSTTTSDVLQIQNTNSSGGSSIQFLNTAGSATSYFGYANPFSNQFQNSTYLMSNSGIPIRIAAGNQTSNPVTFNAVDNSMSISTTTASTDTSSGALKVSGGVGIIGNLNVGGQLNINSPFTVNISSTQASINSTTGAMKLVGGLSIQLADTSNSNATSYTAGGSITVSGGIAVLQDTFIGGILDIKSGANDLNPIKLQSLQISSNFNAGAYTAIQSGNASRTVMSFTPIRFTGYNDQANPKMTINTNTIDLINGLNATNTSNTLGGILFTTAGNVGINTTSPSARLDVITTNTIGNIYLGNNIQNRKMVLFSTNNNEHEYNGLGINSSILRYQVDTINTDHVFYAGVNSTTSNELCRIKGTGDIVVSGTMNSAAISSGNLYSTNSWSVNSSIGTANITSVTANNINFTGNLFQNGNVYIASQWTGTTGSSIYFGSSGNTFVGIGTTNPQYTLDVSGTVRIQNTTNSINSTTGSLTVLGGLSIGSTTDSSSFTEGGSMTIAGGASVAKSLCIGESFNLGGAMTQFGGSFTGGNNVTTPSDVSGLLLPSASTRSFTATVSVSVLRLSGGNYFAQYTIEGIQTDSGWFIDDSFVGDTTGISFSITNNGQIQYTSSNVVNWISTTFTYSVSEISSTGNFIPRSTQTTGNFTVTGILSVTNTTDSTNTSNGALVVSGGVGISDNVNIGGNIVTNGTGYTFGGTTSLNNGPVTNAAVSGLLFPSSNYRSFNIQMSIAVIASTSLYQQCIIEGIQKSDGWSIYVSSLGDVIDVIFDIDTTGQLIYSSTTMYPGWISTTTNYQATAISITGANTPIILATTGNQTLTGSVAITATANATTSSSGALTVAGGVGIAGDLIVAGSIYGWFQYAVFEEQQPNGTNADSYANGSYITRTLNTTVSNSISGCSLNNNQITLSSGTYKINVYCPIYTSGFSKATLFSITDSIILLSGTSAFTNGTSTYSIINGMITINQTTVIVIQQYFANNNTTMGGIATSTGQTETYSHIEIQKVVN